MSTVERHDDPLAYILTRPLGASIGDEMSQKSHQYGGLGQV
jgi:uncharacterized membrane-anchored protein